MRNFLLFSILLSYVCSFGQLIFENEYSQSTVQRVKLEISGEKYYEFDNLNKSVILYNNDHSVWKTIVLQVPDNTNFVFISSVSQTQLNADDDLEIIYTCFYSVNGVSYKEGRVISENGTLLLTVPNVDILNLDKNGSLPTKLIGSNTVSGSGSVGFYTSVVYSFPSLLQEHTYPEGDVKRIVLENSGEKYYLLDKNNQMVRLFNSDHTSWKNIAVPKPPSTAYIGNVSLSETLIDADPQIEVGYCHYGNGASLAKVVNENGDLLLTVENASNTAISKSNGLSPKFTVTGMGATSIYSLPSLGFEHKYLQPMSRIKLDLSGEKYYPVDFQNQPGINLYNSDHTVWKYIPFPETAGLFPSHLSHISQNKINQDGLVEIIYVAENLDQVSSILINENGTFLQSIDGVTNLYINEMEGLESKFIGTQGDFPNYYGAVYGIDFLGIPEFNENTVSVYPNPVKDYLNVASVKNISQIAMYDIKGVLVKESKASDIKNVPVSDLSNGMYFLHLTTETGEQTVKKIIVSK